MSPPPKWPPAVWWPKDMLLCSSSISECKISLALKHAHMYCTVWKNKMVVGFEFKLYQIVDSFKGHTKSKWFFQANVASKKRTNEFYFTTMKPQVDLFFPFVFWRKLRMPKIHFEINWPIPILGTLLRKNKQKSKILNSIQYFLFESFNFWSYFENFNQNTLTNRIEESLDRSK